MAWKRINNKYEFDNSPPDPGVGSSQRPLWLRQANGIRKSKSSEVYVKCRPIGSSIDSFGELSRSYYQGNPREIIRRYFNTLDQIQNSHYVIANPIVLAGDFDIEVDLVTADNSGSITIFGQVVSFGNYFRLQAGVLTARLGGGSALVFTTPVVADGKLHTATLRRRSGGVITVILDGVEYPEDTAQIRTEVVTFDNAGTTGSGAFFDGILANVKFTDKSGAEDVVTTFGLDTPVGNIEYSDENQFGGEMVVNGDFSDGTTGWVSGRNAILSTVNGRLRVTNTDLTSSAGYQLFTVEVGKSYIVKLTGFTGTENTDIRIGIGAGSSVYLRDFSSVSPKEIEAIIIPDNTNFGVSLFVGGGVEGDYCEFDNVSVREITNAVTYIGIPDINEPTPAREEFSFVDGNWLGVSNLSVTGIGSYWTDNGNDSYTIDALNGDFNSLQFSFTDEVPYLYAFNANDPVGVDVLTLRISATSFDFFSATSFSEIITPVGGTSFGRRSGAGAFTQTISDVSIRKILELP